MGIPVQELVRVHHQERGIGVDEVFRTKDRTGCALGWAVEKYDVDLDPTYLTSEEDDDDEIYEQTLRKLRHDFKRFKKTQSLFKKEQKLFYTKINQFLTEKPPERIRNIKRVKATQRRSVLAVRAAERRARLRAIPDLEQEVKKLRESLCILARDENYKEAQPLGEPVREEVSAKLSDLDRERAVRRSLDKYKREMDRWLQAEKKRLQNATSGLKLLISTISV